MIKALERFFVIILIFLSLFSSSYTKQFYLDGNYSETLGCTRMCMRCHMGMLNPAGTTLSISGGPNVLKPGDALTLTVTYSNFGKTWNPGIGIFMDLFSQYAVNSPSVYGWQNCFKSE